jgi:hemerythrin superfamily protein
VPKKTIVTTKEHQPSSIPETQVPVNASEGRIKTPATSDIVDLIISDHLPLKKLIQVLKDPNSMRSSKEGSFEEFVPLLMNHAQAEEKSLYVEMKNIKDLRMQGFEGDTGHALAEQLMQELNGTPDDDEWSAKVKLLAELVENHIKEEEEEILPHIIGMVDVGDRNKIGTMYTFLKKKFETLNKLNPLQETKHIGDNRFH